MKNNKRTIKTISIIFLLLVSVCTISLNIDTDFTENILGLVAIDDILEDEGIKTNYNYDFKSEDSNLKIYFIDVGQADAILINIGSEYALVDAGSESTEEKLISYLSSFNITKFKYIFGTHAHEDHIGGMDKVISNFECENIIFPNVSASTITFERFIDSVTKKNKHLIEARAFDIYNLGNVEIKVLWPNASSTYDNQNNYSIVLKITYKDVSYLLTGDMEVLVENELLKNNVDVRSDVLKIAHHGSATSTSVKFLNAVNPNYAIISVGENNDYGHPKSAILERLSIRNITVYRTDINGTIISETDGRNIKFTFEKGEI